MSSIHILAHILVKRKFEKFAHTYKQRVCKVLVTFCQNHGLHRLSGGRGFLRLMSCSSVGKVRVSF